MKTQEQTYYDLMVMYQTSDRTEADLNDFYFRSLALASIGRPPEDKKVIGAFLDMITRNPL